MGTKKSMTGSPWHIEKKTYVCSPYKRNCFNCTHLQGHWCTYHKQQITNNNADIFYRKRFIMEKEARIDSYFIRKEEITDAEIITEDVINNEEDIIIDIAIENNEKEAND